VLFGFRNSGEYEAAGGTQAPAKEKGGCHLCTGGITSPCCVAKAPAPDDCPWMEATDGVYSVRKTPSFGATVLRFSRACLGRFIIFHTKNSAQVALP
jgi:hypothetical protein